jgi:hypothetical protein
VYTGCKDFFFDPNRLSHPKPLEKLLVPIALSTGEDHDCWIPAKDLNHLEMNGVIDLEKVDQKSRSLLEGLTLQKTLNDLDQTVIKGSIPP